MGAHAAGSLPTTPRNEVGGLVVQASYPLSLLISVIVFFCDCRSEVFMQQGARCVSLCTRAGLYCAEPSLHFTWTSEANPPSNPPVRRIFLLVLPRPLLPLSLGLGN